MEKVFHLNTENHSEMIDITSHVENWIRGEEINNGIIVISSLHTTAGITVNENADPDVQKDMLMRLDEVYPWYHKKDRHGEGNTAAHLKTSTMGSSETLIISGGKIVLGTWQGIYFCEFDGPRRERKYMAKVITQE